MARRVAVFLALPAVIFINAVVQASEPPKPAGAAHLFVGGEVKAPGRFSWTNGMTLTGCIERAGGYTHSADIKHIKVTRAGTNVLVFDYNVAASSPTNNPILSAGDMVMVPRSQVREAVKAAGRKLNLDLDQPPTGRGRFIEVKGEVNRPGQFGWTNGLTLSALIGSAGGLTKAADPGRIQLYFQGGVETWSYARATNSPAWNPPIPAGARIVVPRMQRTDPLAPPEH